MAGKTLLGLDIGSSSIKASLVESETGALVASATSPETELAMDAPQAGWAEQHPSLWWEHIKKAIAMIGSSSADGLKRLGAIGISYQMHGLVIVDESGEVLRPSIIWCDSRAVPYGEKAFKELGEKTSLSRLLNSPGNFTASKLAWVKDNEPEIFGKVSKMMLPGDYIAYLLTGELTTTPSGLSEGIMWDAQNEAPAEFLFDYFGFEKEFIPKIVPTFSTQGQVTSHAAEELGIPKGVPVAYRAGDQPNNAFSLFVLHPGELAATAGTSGVVYGIVDKPTYDEKSRVNTFVHVNHTKEENRYGVLLCLNGTGILNRWLKQMMIDPNSGKPLSYEEMNRLADDVPIGAEGITVLPFGNGAERILENANPGASVHGLNFNIHTQAHLVRAGQEGIVFALNYGLEIMRNMGLSIETVKAGFANMFLSPLFQNCFATVTNTSVHLYNTDGSLGAARGAGIGAGIYAGAEEAFAGLESRKIIEPDSSIASRYEDAYGAWRRKLEQTGAV